ncbi:MAG: hypothetical protein JST54_05005 [Deltaproteobacteria bacterium]|nr:hypothetical protein [Deltaproteobacteria bacterium]
MKKPAPAPMALTLPRLASEVVRIVDLQPVVIHDGRERALALRVEIHALSAGGFESRVYQREFYRMQPSFHLSRRADERLWAEDVMFVWEGQPAQSADEALAATLLRIAQQLAPAPAKRTAKATAKKKPVAKKKKR